MLAALTLALRNLADRHLLWLLIKSLLVSLIVFAVLCGVGWYGLQAVTAWALPDGGSELQQALAAAMLVLGGVLLWRLVALAVLQFYSDDVIAVVEASHYPAAHSTARNPDWREELQDGFAAAGRALLANLIALPFALLLLVTGIGTPLLFWAVNAVLLGRELDQMVWRRHRPSRAALSPLKRSDRLVLGGIVSALFIVPFINFLAPFIGAAMAAHLHHRKGTQRHAA